MNEEYDKKIDNKILITDSIEEYKNQINEVNEKIDIEKRNMNDLDDIEDIVVSLNKSFDDCISILRTSMSGPTVNNKLNSLEENNTINLNKTIGDIEIKREEILNNISKLYDDKGEIEDNFRSNMNEKSHDNDIEGSE